MNEWSHGIAWSKDLETGNDPIDSQHKELFRLTSSLVEACEKNESAKVVEDTLNFLASYTVKHFADEEKLQKMYNFPGYEQHKKLHDDFKVKVTELIQLHKTDGASSDLHSRINSTVVRWLIQHITREDFKIAEHIRKTASRK